MPLAANAAGFLIAFTFSFVAQYGWTFGDRTRGLGRSARQAARLRFLAVAVMGFALNASFVALVEALPDADPRAAAVFMVFVTPIVTFLLLKHWAFGKSAVRLDQEKSVRRTGASIFRARDRGWLLPLLAVLAVTPLLASSVFFGLPQSLDPDEGIFMGKALCAGAPYHAGQLVTLLLAAAFTLPTVLAGLEVARTRAFDRDTRVLLETDAPGISATDYAAFVVKDGAVLPWSELEQRSRVTGYYTYFGQWSRPAGDFVAAIRQQGIDYVIMSEWADRFQLEAAVYPHELDVYIELQRAFPVVQQFVPAAGWSGPRISIRAVE